MSETVSSESPENNDAYYYHPVDDLHLLADGRPVISWIPDPVQEARGIGATGTAYLLSANEEYDHFYVANAPGHGIVVENHSVVEDKRWESYNAARLTRDAEIREAARIYLAGGKDLLAPTTIREVEKDLKSYPPLATTWLPDADIIQAIREGRKVAEAIPIDRRGRSRHTSTDQTINRNRTKECD